MARATEACFTKMTRSAFSVQPDRHFLTVLRYVSVLSDTPLARAYCASTNFHEASDEKSPACPGVNSEVL